MYLAPKINRRLDTMREVLTGSVPLDVVWEEVDYALKPFGIKVYMVPDETLRRPDFMCSGSYDFFRKKQPIEIVLHFNVRNRCYDFSKKRWKNFKFLLSQVEIGRAHV